jgi:hypothetical protein
LGGCDRPCLPFRPLDFGMIPAAQMSSSLTVSASIAMSEANRNVAEKVPRLILPRASNHLVRIEV